MLRETEKGQGMYPCPFVESSRNGLLVLFGFDLSIGMVSGVLPISLSGPVRFLFLVSLRFLGHARFCFSFFLLAWDSRRFIAAERLAAIRNSLTCLLPPGRSLRGL